jgi:hypothetical protein
MCTHESLEELTKMKILIHIWNGICDFCISYKLQVILTLLDQELHFQQQSCAPSVNRLK